MRPLLRHVEQVLDAARMAPSHDNAQPWRFVVDGETISFSIDHERDRSPGGRVARIGIGAALENALLAARRMGANVTHHAPREGALVTFTVSEPKRENEPDKARVRRGTNRRPYDGRAIDDATFLWLREATPPIDTARTHWFGRERVRALAPLIEEGETLYFADPRLRAATLAAIRFDVRDKEEVAKGLSVGSLELSAADRMTLFGLRKDHSPALAMAEYRKMGSRARRLFESAAGVCIVTARGEEPAVDVAVGRAMEQAWLALTRRDLAAQPMTAMVSLAATEEHPGDAPPSVAAAAEDERRAKVRELLGALRGAFPSFEPDARIALLMRFGHAEQPSARVGRLPLEDSVADVGP